MSSSPRAPASLLVIFGATGDLAQRMLFPSLYGLQAEGLCPSSLRVLGTGRTDIDASAFRDKVAAAVRRHTPANECDEDTLQALLARIDYLAANTGDEASLQNLGERIRASRDGDVVYHLSTAPRFYGSISAALGRMGLTGPGTRVLLEKPIGHDLASAQQLNADLLSVFRERQIYRIDHYLANLVYLALSALLQAVCSQSPS